MRELFGRRRRTSGAIFLAVVAALTFTGCFSQGYARSRKRPFGQMDSPTEGAVAKTPYGITGWAVSEAGIRDVWIYVDRQFYKAAQMHVLRPDIAKGYPYLPHSNRAGYGLELDIYPLKNGPHLITVQAVGENGMVADVGNATLIVQHEEDKKKK